MVGPVLLDWFRRAIDAMVDEAGRGHGPDVERRSAVAGSAAGDAAEKPWESSVVGALRHLPVPAADSLALANELVAISHALPWTPSARVDDGGAAVGLVDLLECIEIDLAGAGLMFLAPGAGYPEHQHHPAEVYLVLHGARRWRFGGSERYIAVDAGQVLSNSSMDVHGVERGADPLLALWVLMDDRQMVESEAATHR